MIHISSMLMSSVGWRLEKSQVIELRNRFVLGRNIFIIVFFLNFAHTFLDQSWVQLPFVKVRALYFGPKRW